MKKICYLVALLLFSTPPSTLLANGGGYHHGVEFTGSVTPFTAEGTENVQIIDEKLDITLGDKSAKVSVLYQMKNITDKKINVKFGFPVEDVHSRWDYEFSNKQEPKEPVYTQNYKVTLNGKQLKHKYIKEPYGADGDKKLKPFKGSEILKEIKGWQVTQMTLKKGETVSLLIQYDSQYDAEVYSISDDSSEGPWLFKYRLSTGAVWHGPIKKGTVAISYSKTLLESDVRIIKPVNKYKKIKQTYVWEFENLEPTLADDITVQAISQKSEYRYSGEDKKIHSYVNLDQKWFIKHTDFSIKASSTLADQGDHNYSVENLKKQWSNIWSEGAKGDGLEESLALKLNTPSKVAAISIRNGHFGNPDNDSNDLFKKNNRVKSIEALINGTEKQMITLADTSEERHYLLNYDKPITSLKLTIKSVYPGTQYKDTCLSSVSLLERIAKEPKSYGAR